MKKTVLILGCLLAVGVTSVSCNRDDNENVEKNVNVFDSTKTNGIVSYTKSTSSINNSYGSLQTKEGSEVIIFSNIKTIDENVNEQMEGLIVEIDLKNSKAYFKHRNHNEVMTYDLKKQENGTLKMVKSIEQNIEIASNEYRENSSRWSRWGCGASCVASGLTWALIDGPSPIMDMAAIASTYLCAKRC